MKKLFIFLVLALGITLIVGGFLFVSNNEEINIKNIFGSNLKGINELAVWGIGVNNLYYQFENDLLSKNNLGTLTAGTGNVFNSTSFKLGSYSREYGNTEDDFNTTTTLTAFGTGNFTIAYWTNNLDVAAETAIIGSSTTYGSVANSWVSRLLGAGTVTFSQDTGVDEIVTSTTAVNNGSWQRVVITRNGTGANEVGMYVNGILEDTGISTLDMTVNGLYVGGSNTGGTFLDGKLDDVYINKGTAWTLAEVVSDWNSGAGKEIEGGPITLNSPENNYISNTNSVDFNCSANQNGATLTNISLWHNGTGTWTRDQTNITIDPTTNTTIFTSNIIENSPTLWTCSATDSDNDEGFATSNRTVNVDSTPPTISITYPTTLIDSHIKGTNISVNWTVSDTNLDTCWYDYQGVNTTMTCLNLNVSINISDYNNRTINLWANDSVNNFANDSSTWVYNLWEDSQTYDASVTEGSTNNFIARINYTSANWNLITASLWYNYTEYSGTKTGSVDHIIFNANVSAPSVSGATSIPFNWRIGLTNASGTTSYNLTNYTQTVNTVNMSYCGVTYNIPFINFTFYDEETLEKANGTIDLTFNYRSSTSPTTFNDIFSYSNDSVDVQSHQFCFDPADETFTVDAIIEYDSPSYTHRFYNFEGIEFTNSTTEIGLYLLNESKSTSFIINVLDNNYYPVVGAEVYVQRYYASTDTWVTLEILETNDDGETIQHLFTEDVLYRFKVYSGGTLLHTTSQSVIACKATPCTVTIVITDSIDNIYDPIPNLETSLTMDGNYLISYTYTDTSGSFESARLNVVRNNPGTTSLQPVCNSTSTSSTAVLTCDLFPETNGTYIAKGYITRSGSEDNVERKVFYKERDIISGIGLDGLLWSIFFLMGIVMLGIYRPSMAIIFSIVGVFLLSLLQLMEISITAIVAIIGVGIVLLFEVKNQ